jgi:hypothetical protein
MTSNPYPTENCLRTALLWIAISIAVVGLFVLARPEFLADLVDFIHSRILRIP